MAEELSELGRRVARRYIFRDVRPRPSDLAKQLGVEITFLEKSPPAQPRLRSEYRADPPHIIIYTDNLSTLEAAIHANQRFDMMRCNLAEVHIAHELFHHLEFGGRFGPYDREEVEAAAHSFTQELLELDFHPTEFDGMVG